MKSCVVGEIRHQRYNLAFVSYFYKFLVKVSICSLLYFHWVRSFGIIRNRISDPRSLGPLYIKAIGQFTLMGEF